MLFSALKRLITAVSSPFRLMLTKFQKLFNINVITSKLIAPMTKQIKKLITLRPQSKQDYFVIGRFWVYKKIFATLILALCAGVFIYFTMYADPIPQTTTIPSSVVTNTTFDYDDMKLGEFTGVANIRAANGQVVYIGDIDKGIAVGKGTLYDTEGTLRYVGAFAANQFSGEGKLYYPNGAVEYEGAFSDNKPSGEGKYYSNASDLLYEGNFKAGQFSGAGKAYSEDGILVYEGAFASGKYHGDGVAYSNAGIIQYQGAFFEGLAQGQGVLYNKAGKTIYTGLMQAGHINYAALVGASLADIEAAFTEPPVICYSGQSSVFVFKEAGVILNAACTVRVDVWEREATSSNSGSLYYIPTKSGDGLQSGTAAKADANMAIVSSVPLRYAAKPGLSIEPISWFVVGGTNGSSTTGGGNSESTGSTGGTDSTGGTGNTGGSSSSSSSSGSSGDTSGGSSAGGSGNASSDANSTPQATSAPQPTVDPNAGVPDFIEKNITIYYEIDTNIWRCESDASWEEDKALVKMGKVTVFNPAMTEPEGQTFYDDKLPPMLEDCVAIDYLRMTTPTRFSDIRFEMNKENALFIEVSNIDYASRIYRNVYDSEGLTYRYCYEDNSMEIPLFFSVEAID